MSERAFTKVSTHDDGRFIRTAIIASTEEGGSVAIVNTQGERLALLNIFTNEQGSWLAVDVIDKDEVFSKHTAITFHDGDRKFSDATTIVGADFRKD